MRELIRFLRCAYLSLSRHAMAYDFGLTGRDVISIFTRMVTLGFTDDRMPKQLHTRQLDFAG